MDDTTPPKTPITITLLDGTVIVGACRDRGYAGYYRDGDTEVYLLVDPPEDAADARKALAETFCVMDSRGTPSGKIRVEKADYSGAQLDEWYARMRDRIWSVRGLHSTDIDEVRNRIRLGVNTEAGRRAIEAHLTDLEIPLEAVIVDVRPPAQLDDPPARPAADNGLRLSVEHAATFTSGIPGRFAVVLANEGPDAFTVTWNALYPVDVAVFANDGTEVWKLIRAGAMPVPAGIGTLTPGEDVRFDVLWPQEDNDGVALPPGQYLVRAYMHLSMEGTSPYERVDLATAPREFQIVPE